MEKIEEIRTAEYLLRASPETVYEWLKAWPQRTPEYRFFFGNDIPEEIEQKLLERNNEIVDIALASWGTNKSIKTQYHRWCDRSAVTEWPPQPSTYPYAVLASILANVNWILPRQGLESTSIPTDDFEWLIEHADDDLFRLMHNNIALGCGLLLRCAKKEGVYGRLDDDRWLFALGTLGYNNGLHRSNEDNNDGPDLDHYNIHQAFVQAATISPKTSDAAYILGQLFEYLPSAATDGAYVRDELLAAAVQAWNVEIKNNELLQITYQYDALTPSERVQFHLLRHYGLYFDLDPDDPVKVRRLAAYSKNPVNGGKGWGPGYQNQLENCTGKGLDIESFQTYSRRDGKAFMFANSFNKYIWADKEASQFEWRTAFEQIKFPYPKDATYIYLNRQKCVDDAAANESLKPSDPSEKSDSIEVKTLTTIGEIRQEIAQAQGLLNAQIGNLKKWLIWGGIIVVVLLLFRL